MCRLANAVFYPFDNSEYPKPGFAVSRISKILFTYFLLGSKITITYGVVLKYPFVFAFFRL